MWDRARKLKTGTGMMAMAAAGWLFRVLAFWGLVVVALAGAGAPAGAQLPEWTPPGTGAWAETPEGRVRLVAARTAINGETKQRLGLQFDLAEGWKVYWRSPGDAGYPPSIDWNGSENLTETEMGWPAPERFSVLGIETLGYRQGVIYPITARVEDPGRSLRTHASVDYLTCADVCIPRTVALTLDLPAGPGGPSTQAHAINQAEAAVPGDGTAHGMTLDHVAVAAEGPTTLRVGVRADPPLTTPDLFVEGPVGSWFGPPRVASDPDTGLTVLWVEAGGVESLTGVPLTLTVADGARAMEVRAVPDPAGAAPHPLLAATPPPMTDGAARDGAPQTATPMASPATLLGMVALALAGGLILNLMPCVLPVLSIKLLGLVSHGGGPPRRARVSFLMSAAGIVASFLALGVAAIAIKTAGLAVGWGIQFQQPLFLVPMIVILSLFAANLWGLFEVRLPERLSGVGGCANANASASANAGNHDSAWGAFATGAFATLLATPCSAPFLGTAVGFALARGAGEIALIFLALGIGMALPYLLVAARPSLATRLPRPGRWMIALKAVLGLALAATAAWLLSVLSAQVPPLAAAVVAGLMVLMVLALALPRVWPRGRAMLAGLAALAALALPAWSDWLPAAPPSPGRTPGQETASTWRPFDADAIPALVAEGRRVVVDVTADWCVTCLVNKRVVLDRDPVATRLAGEDIVLMRADWTRPDADIAAYLASFERYGIPFNAVYGPGAPEGLVLPELLSPAPVLEAIEAAGGPS